MKRYPTDPRGAEDHGEYVAAKPCAARLNTIPLSWCVMPPGHAGACAAPVMRPVKNDDLGPEASKRRRFDYVITCAAHYCRAQASRIAHSHGGPR